MAFPIQPKRNGTSGSSTPPAVSDLLLGELAVNTQSKKTFLRVNGDEVVEVGWDRILSTDAVETATAGKVVKLNSSGIISKAQISGLQYDQISDASQTSTGVANKIPLTTSTGKIDSSFLPAASVGALTYKGAWTVNSSPVIASGGVVGSGTAEKGDYYIAANSAALDPAIDGQTYVQAGDMIAYNGAGSWDFIDGAKSEVRSVNSVAPTAAGNVVLTAANVEAVATADAVLTATPGKVVKLDSNGKISDVQLNVASTTQLGVISVDNASSNGFQVSVAGAAKIIPGTSTIVGGVKSSDSINIALDGTATVASAGTY
jgi:hypothetical protein